MDVLLNNLTKELIYISLNLLKQIKSQMQSKFIYLFIYFFFYQMNFITEEVFN